MISANENFTRIPENYIFADVARRLADYKKEHPKSDVINLGIGDVTLPLPYPISRAMAEASLEMSTPCGFRGYPPDGGYPFLREKLATRYADFGIALSWDEIFISDGAKSDLAAIQELFDFSCAMQFSPSYPVFGESCLLRGKRLVSLPATRENGFLPPPPKDFPLSGCLISICSPANPTGAAYDRAGLSAWVDFALKSGSLIIFDCAYEAYIRDSLPHSIFEIPEAKYCAVETGSFSKAAGMTGVRCSWCAIPRELRISGAEVRALWSRRQNMKFNGVSYIIQRGAEAALSEECKPLLRSNIDYYAENAAILAEVLRRRGVYFSGGRNSPYLWLRCGNSQRFFEALLHAGVVGTPGSGFGAFGEGYFRLTAFASRKNIIEATALMDKFLQSDNNFTLYSP
ncbi:lL-diaminopimelate aminotransferase [Candidatus Apopatosoma intestinale]|nr:lL-diaminopimelate aminotransferase [Candidatus Apopatosoma intestinale]